MTDMSMSKTRQPRGLSRKGRSMQRKVAYVFLYKNGIRERSVGILRRYGTAEQPEVALELFGEDVRKETWRIYYFTRGEALAEAAYLWGTTTERGRSEVKIQQCRLCAEVGRSGGIVLLPDPTGQGNRQEVEGGRKPKIRRTDLREYLCARYDGKEVTVEELWEAFCRKPAEEVTEKPCIESAKRLMEEITKAAEGERGNGEPQSERNPEGKVKEPRKVRKQMMCLEELLFLNPSYVPCRRYDVEYSVRITPEDLLHLPKESRKYAENSFILHGYYRYRHVLLGRRKRNRKEEYVVLVPGNYNEKEAGLAELFGFPEFLPVKMVAQAKKVAPETGVAVSSKELFGYFCGKI